MEWVIGMAVVLVLVLVGAVVALAVQLRRDAENNRRLSMLAAEVHAFGRVARRRALTDGTRRR